MGRRPAFTLVELLVVIAIIAVLMGLLIPAITGVKRVADRNTCANNLRNIGHAFLSFEADHGGYPRAGEHIVHAGFIATAGATQGNYDPTVAISNADNIITPGAAPVNMWKSQDLQSPMLMVLPYLEHSDDFAKYDLRYPYNDPRVSGGALTAIQVGPNPGGPTQGQGQGFTPGGTGNNATVGFDQIKVFQCPSNPLSNLRFNNGRTDSIGFGIADYTTLPYVEAATAPGNNQVYALLPSALTGAQYPGVFYHKFLAADAQPISHKKSVQLDTTVAGTFNQAGPGGTSVPLTGANSLSTGGTVGSGNKIDPMFGLPRRQDITDGAANSIMLYEDVGRNENMDGYDPVKAAYFINEYYDPVASEALGAPTKRAHWRWIDPDTASGMLQKINNASGGSMDFPDPNVIDPQNKCVGWTWHAHDCGANNEAFSFHGAGAHVVFADGHVVFMRSSVTQEVLRALGTRSNHVNEGSLADNDKDW
jgi:prepilin-type N-terminal cleavage/methylation domain-containing protein/prepilin-type processing-associated H-X9-DG protein